METSVRIPLSALILGLAGVVPFAVSALAMTGFLGIDVSLAWRSLQAYAAVILSFLGAVHWGAAIGKIGDESTLARSLGFSVLPCLAAWVILIAQLSPAVSLVALILAFVGQYLADRRAALQGLLPAWYRRLRQILTGLVVLVMSLTLGALLTFASA